jgi:hypothetical protein
MGFCTPTLTEDPALRLASRSSTEAMVVLTLVKDAVSLDTIANAVPLARFTPKQEISVYSPPLKPTAPHVITTSIFILVVLLAGSVDELVKEGNVKPPNIGRKVRVVAVVMMNVAHTSILIDLFTTQKLAGNVVVPRAMNPDRIE